MNAADLYDMCDVPDVRTMKSYVESIAIMSHDYISRNIRPGLDRHIASLARTQRWGA